MSKRQDAGTSLREEAKPSQIGQTVFGVEEEVFVTEPGRPSLRSLYYLSQLLRKNPRFYYFHSASNFAGASDVREGLMGGVEISTGCHHDVGAVIADLKARRRDLASVASGLIVPLGHLIDYSSPTNTCALQVHVGGVADMAGAYVRLVHFLPLLACLTTNSPCAGGRYYGPSYRIAHSNAIGRLRNDWTFRYQDIIYSRRLGTIEIRVFDPVWDTARIEVLLRAIATIVETDLSKALDTGRYNRLRGAVARVGVTAEIGELWNELRELFEIPREMLDHLPAESVHACYARNGLIKTYSALDNAYRGGPFIAKRLSSRKKRLLEIPIGVAGYYIPKLPYVVWKYLQEA